MSDSPSFCGTRAIVRGTTCKWPQRTITYRVEARIPGLTADQIRRGFVEAISPWQEEADIVLEPRPTGPVNVLAIDLRMDGPNGVLADCQLPCGLPSDFQLTMRFDNIDVWTFDKYVKTARHEFGHGLGLGHASERGNIMYPSLDMKVTRLGPGDIGEVVGRYGRRTRPIPRPTPTPTPPETLPPGFPVPRGLPLIFPDPVAINGVIHKLSLHGLPGRLVGRTFGPWESLVILDADHKPWNYILSPDTPT